MAETPKLTVRISVDARDYIRGLKRLSRHIGRRPLGRRNRRRRRRFRWLCWFGFHWWESDIMNDWRVIEEKCCRCGKERTLRFKLSVLK